VAGTYPPRAGDADGRRLVVTLVYRGHVKPIPGSLAGIAAAVAFLLTGCGTPIGVHRMAPRTVERELDSNVISTGRLSEAPRIVVHRETLADRFQGDPAGAIAEMHRIATTGTPRPDALFALAEMAFHRAEETGEHVYFLAAAVYAYAFLFPDDPTQRPSG